MVEQGTLRAPPLVSHCHDNNHSNARVSINWETMRSCSRHLRAEPHLRGHVAACNGRVELVRARAELCSPQDAIIPPDSREIQAKAEERERRKEEQLLAFQRSVRERVQRKERARLQQLSETANRHSLSNISSKPQTQCPLAEREEVAVSVGEPSSAVQRARLTLLSASSHPPSLPPPSLPPAPELEEPPSATPARMSPAPSCVERSAGRRFTAAHRIALERQKSQARQLHLFHRLYSHLEREGVRERQSKLGLQERAEQRRRESEFQRRMVEDEGAGLVVSVGRCEEEDRERVEEWRQTVALERRRHKLQVARETERYLEALKAQLRDRLAASRTCPPPLCSCGSSLWDTDPLTCANNCPFYRNPRGEDYSHYSFLVK